MSESSHPSQAVLSEKVASELLLGPVIGGLTHKRANLWGRAALTAHTAQERGEVLHAWLGKSADLSDAVLAGQSLPLRPEDGYAGVAPISGLQPDTPYHYTLTLSDQPPDPSAGPYPGFTSFPLPGQPRSFSFAFGSCFRPEDAGGGQIFDSLQAQRQRDDLRFILLLGDQIYADSRNYNSLGRVACTLEDYRQVYAYTWSRPPLRRLLAGLPAFMTIDDHEVDDDWTWTNAERSQAQIPIWDRLERWLRRCNPQERRLPRQRVQAALQAYWEHQAMHAPPMVQPPDLDGQGRYNLSKAASGSLAYEFTFGAAAFFVLDTRSRRIKSRHVRSMLGESQWTALESWLLRVRDVFPLKFIVTSCSLLYNMAFDVPRDRWAGFPKEQARLLHFLAAHGIEGVYLLAGDLHAAHAVSAELYGPQDRALPLWEFCSSPFEQNTNWLSRFSYRPLSGLPLKNQQVQFTSGQHNYGIVRVDYDVHDQPAVRFELYGRDGSLLAQAP